MNFRYYCLHGYSNPGHPWMASIGKRGQCLQQTSWEGRPRSSARDSGVGGWKLAAATGKRIVSNEGEGTWFLRWPIGIIIRRKRFLPSHDKCSQNGNYDISFRQIFTPRSLSSLHAPCHVIFKFFRWPRSMLHVHILCSQTLPIFIHMLCSLYSWTICFICLTKLTYIYIMDFCFWSYYIHLIHHSGWVWVWTNVIKIADASSLKIFVDTNYTILLASWLLS